MRNMVCYKATPKAPRTINTIPTTDKIIPKILEILLAIGGNIFAIAYRIIPITSIIIP